MTDSVACRSRKCRVQDGETWPKCMGPNGCMRDQPLEAEPIVAHMPTPKRTRKVWNPKPKPPPKPAPIVLKPKPKPQKTRTRQSRSTRKSVSVSVSGKLFAKFEAKAELDPRSMSRIIEDETNRFLGLKVDN